MKYVIGTRWLVNPNQDRSHFHHGVWGLYKCLIHCQSGDSCGG